MSGTRRYIPTGLDLGVNALNDAPFDLPHHKTNDCPEKSADDTGREPKSCVSSVNINNQNLPYMKGVIITGIVQSSVDP